MDEYDLISDSYSMELMMLLVAERIWARVQKYLQDRDLRMEAIQAERDKQENEDKQNEQLSGISRSLAEIQGKQGMFESYLKKKMQ